MTAPFGLIRVLTTGVGEAAADYPGAMSVVPAGAVGIVGLALTLAWQFRAREHVAARDWSAMARLAVFGTMVADGPHVVLGLPYPVCTLLHVIVVAACSLVWRHSEGTLSVHSITTRRREAFHWVTVLATFALGTALGDLTAMVWHLGLLWSGIVFAVLIAVPEFGRARFGLDPVVAFWSAYVLTRPLGASFADRAGKPHSTAGGLGDDGAVTLVTGVLIVGLVAWWPGGLVRRHPARRPAAHHGRSGRRHRSRAGGGLVSWIEAIVLGVVQGLTEFVPSSSSAHLRIVGALFASEDPGAAFTAVIQIGTELAVLLHFARDTARIITAWVSSLRHRERRSDPDARMGWLMIVGSIPIVVLGLAWQNTIETTFRDLRIGSWRRP